MLVSYKWLQTFFEEELPSTEEIADILTFGAFEIEGIEKKDDDTVIDVDVLPNRASDCLSHYGIVREISTLIGISIQYKMLEAFPELSPKISGELQIIIEDTKLCPVYCGALIRGVKVGPSPDWIRERLEVLGHKSINNVVDATNYVLLAIGQPTHVFDAKKLIADSLEHKARLGIGVRAAKSGEKITVLGDDEYKLTEEMTVITDANADVPIAIAGVKGGAHAEVDEQTTDIVIESAKFNPAITRRTAQELVLRTDASKRFENEVPNELPFYGIKLVVDLILKIAGGELVGYAGTEPQENKPYKLGISVGEVNKTLGTNLSDSDISDAFNKLGFLYERIESPIERVLKLAPTLQGKPYKYGASVSKDAPEQFDCSSFLAYLFAQNGISIPRVVIDQYVYGTEISEDELVPGDLIFSVSDENKRKPHKFVLRADGKEYVHNGPMYETQEFARGTKVEKGVSHNGLYLGNGEVVHASGKNGVNVEKYAESDYFKHTVGFRRIDGGLESRFVVNVPFNRLDLRQSIDLIEEVGRVYGYKNIQGESLSPHKQEIGHEKEYILGEYVRSMLTEAGCTEILTYSLTDRGDVKLANALASDKDHLRSNLYDAMKEKLDLNEKNAPLLGLYNGVRMFEIGRVFTEGAEETHVCVGVSGKDAQAYVGDVLKTLGVQETVEINNGVVEFSLSSVNKTDDANHSPSNIANGIMYMPISQYPFVLRDIAVWVPENTRSDEITKVVKAHAGDLLVRQDMFDEYKKDDRISYAFHLVFQSSDKTLTDEEVSNIMKKIESEMASRGFDVR